MVMTTPTMTSTPSTNTAATPTTPPLTYIRNLIVNGDISGYVTQAEIDLARETFGADYAMGMVFALSQYGIAVQP